MHVEQRHNLGREEAVRRINAGVEELLGQDLPAGVVVTGVSRTWSEDTMRFSFTAKKGFFGVPISGAVQVTEDLAALDAELPGLLTAWCPNIRIGVSLLRISVGLTMAMDAGESQRVLPFCGDESVCLYGALHGRLDEPEPAGRH
jgi:hypothetical protein